MKKHHILKIMLVLALLLNIMVFAEVEEFYTWGEYDIEEVKLNDEMMFAPGNMKEDEYSVGLSMTVSKDFFEENNLLKTEIYEQMALLDEKGNTYFPSASASSEESLSLLFLYAIPKEVESNTLSVSFIEKKKIEFILENGDTFILYPEKKEEFINLSQEIMVKTAFGDTHHESGAVFKEGSGLSFEKIKNTKEYKEILIPFSYEPLGEKEAEGKALEEVGKRIILFVEGKEHYPKVLWFTDSLVTLIFGGLPPIEEPFIYTYTEGKLYIALGF